MEPILFDPTSNETIMSPQGQAMVPGFTDIPGSKISMGIVYMPPGGIANAHRHVDTDIIVYLIEAGPLGAITLWGNNLENVIVQHIGQQLYMPAGIPHVAINPSDIDHIRACEYRSSGRLMQDNELLPELQAIAVAVQEKFGLDSSRGAV